MQRKINVDVDETGSIVEFRLGEFMFVAGFDDDHERIHFMVGGYLDNGSYTIEEVEQIALNLLKLVEADRKLKAK